MRTFHVRTRGCTTRRASGDFWCRGEGCHSRLAAGETLAETDRQHVRDRKFGFARHGKRSAATRSSTECRPTSWTNERGEVGAAVQYYGVAKFARVLQL